MIERLPCGSTIGIVGGGQLGMLLATAARSLGYRTHVFCQDPAATAAREANRLTVASWDDDRAITAFSAATDVVTIETEDVPVAALERMATITRVAPAPTIVRLTQDRGRQRAYLACLGIPTPRSYAVYDEASATAAADAIHGPAVLKTSRQGYDGKGQVWIESGQGLWTAWEQLGRLICVVEERVPFVREFSVIVARNAAGHTCTYDPIENHHETGILRLSTVPAAVPPAAAAAAAHHALRFAEASGLVGIACFEWYLLADGSIRVNEVATRPHNSGHLTIEAAATSQFEQLVRAITGNPLGPANFHSRATMHNLIGAVDQRDLDTLIATSQGSPSIYLYGKEPRPGRKLGHVTLVQAETHPPSRAAQAMR